MYRDSTANIYVMGGMFNANRPTSVPKSVPRLILDKVRLLFSSEMFYSSQIKVSNKSLSHELNNVLFYSCCCCTVNFVGLEKTVTEMATGCLRTMKSCYICIK